MNDPAPSKAPQAYDLYRTGHRLLDDGDAAAAIEPLERAVALEPQSTSLREALARALFATSRIRSARREFEQVLVLDPSNAYAHYGLGRTYEREGRLVQAAKHFKLATAMSSHEVYRRAAERIARRTERGPTG